MFNEPGKIPYRRIFKGPGPKGQVVFGEFSVSNKLLVELVPFTLMPPIFSSKLTAGFGSQLQIVDQQP